MSLLRQSGSGGRLGISGGAAEELVLALWSASSSARKLCPHSDLSEGSLTGACPMTS